MQNILMAQSASGYPYGFSLNLLCSSLPWRAIFLSFIWLTAFQPSASAQTTKPLINSTLNGKVFDAASKDPLLGATISIEGTTHKAITDKNGNFNFVTGQKFPYTLIISYLGYKTLKIVANGTPVDIALVADLNNLNDVIIVGYGTQRKADLVGSVAKIDAKQAKLLPVASFDAQLQGRVSGLQVNSNSGIPGEGTFVRVRGTTSINAGSDPLYIVDGIFLNNSNLQTVYTGGRGSSPLADINPADIESIEVLKDAAATAIYGARGANGVVIVTTKRGEYNTRTKVSLNVAQGWVQAEKSRLPKLATGPESAAMINESWINSGIDNPNLKQTFANRPFRPIAEGGAGLPEEQQTYDRFEDLLRKGYLQTYDLSIQGGTKDSKYYVGAGYTKQDAFIKVLTFSRGSFKFNFDQKVTDKINFGLTNTVSRSYRNQARTGEGPTGSLWNSLFAATYTPKFDPNGSSIGSDNLYILVDNYDVNSISLRYLGNFHADAEIFKNLKFKTSFSIDHNDYDESEYWNSKTRLGAAPVNGLATSSITKNSTWLNEQTLSYNTKIQQHSLNVVLGNSIQRDEIKRTAAEGRGFANDSFKLISAAATRTSSQYATGSALASFFGRVSYNYLDRYYVEATARADGSSKFGTDNKWGYFPSIGVAWRIKDESFLRNAEQLNDLKIRASYGVTGNQSGINNFAARGLWTGGASYADAVNADAPGIAPLQLGNNALKWETTVQSNIGVDASFFADRLAVTIDLYRKYTSDLLLLKPVASTTGFGSYYANDGEISNKGYELGINLKLISNKQFTWKTNINAAGNFNKIEKLATPINSYTRGWVRMQEGYSMNSFWLYDQLYVDPKTGAPVFAGQDAKGNVTTENRVIMGNNYPKIYGGLSNDFTYRNFDFSVLFTFQAGNKALNLDRYFRERNGTGGTFIKQLDRWQKEGDITDVPRLTTVGNNYSIDQNSRFLEDASFIRLKQLTLGYTLSKQFAKSIGIAGARLYATGTNLKLWSKYTGADPEANVTSDPNVQGLAWGTPPQPQGFQFGINVSL